jgi:fumarate hydratase class II
MIWVRRPLSLGDASEKLRRYSVAGSELDRDKITDDVDRSLMLVTALSPHIGYDKACAIAHKTDHYGTACARQPLPWACGRQTSRASLTRGR